MGNKAVNILYLHCHDTGRYIQPFGYGIPTPNLMELAQEGVLLRNLHCAAPSCSPSRAALLTGMYPHTAGMQGLVNRGFDLDKKENTMPRWLSDHGYYTVLAGIQHVLRVRCAIGYNVTLPDVNLTSPQIVEQGLAALDGANGKPFFLDLGFADTHRPFEDEVFSCSPDYVQPPALLPDTLESRRDMAGFITEAGRFDAAVGLAIEGLRARDLLANTLILCTTDHGIAFPGMKCNLTVHGTGVFAILTLPGCLPAGMVSDALASQIDFFPTLCELAGVPKPEWLEGVSLVPVLTGETKQVRRELFTEAGYHCSYEPQRCIRTNRYAYIRRYTERDMVYCANSDQGYVKELWLKNGWQQRRIPCEQLYDTLFDPMEMRNEAENPAYEQVLTDLRKRLNRWQEETGDPILRGKIEPNCTNTPDGGVYVSAADDLYTYDIWGRQPCPDEYG